MKNTLTRTSASPPVATRWNSRIIVCAGEMTKTARALQRLLVDVPVNQMDPVVALLARGSDINKERLARPRSC
eukprot:4777833-Lingulodinium_polyedra.AAC.1